MGRGRKRAGFHPWELEVLYWYFFGIDPYLSFCNFSRYDYIRAVVLSTEYGIMYYLTCLWRH